MTGRIFKSIRRVAGLVAAGASLSLCLPASPASAATGTFGYPQRLTNYNSGLCLEVQGWSTVNGGAVGQWDCHLGKNQQWFFADQGPGDIIWNANSGKCLEVADWSTLNGAPIRQWECTGRANQQWVWMGTVKDGWNYNVIRNVYSNKCLEVADWRRDNGAPVRQWDCHYGDNQVFYVADAF
ncbi:RICIN domain-containing protein [Streptomyces sp. NPDC058084]|uniref:RICIN domain-containing protein n=1 Tax=Streptomyces sp. NPDC058084 TaxID=3346333 RepID=UPI0036F079AD